MIIKRPFALFLTMSLIFMSAIIVDAKNMVDLEFEALSFSTRLMPKKNIIVDPEKNQLLADAAQVMLDQDQCREALMLYRQSIRLGKKTEGSFWQKFTEAAMCAEDWKQSSWGAFHSYASNNTSEQQAIALTQLGLALEKRSGYQEDWKPAALDAYERLLKIADDKVVRERVTSLKNAEQEEKDLILLQKYATSDKNNPELCLSFNDRLLDSSKIYYEDYIRISPELDTVFSINGKDVCAAGAEFGTEYEVVVRKGFRAENKVAAKTSRLSIKTGHRSPAVWFNNNTYVLPKSAQSGIGLYTVNTDELNLQLFRVHEQNILNEFVHRRFRSNQDQNELDKIAGSVGEPVWQNSVMINGEQDKIHISSLILPESILSIPGLYVLSAANSKEKVRPWEEQATQWLVVTDIGLTSYRGDDGLTLVARSLETAKPLVGIEITLYARNNKPLAIVTTDSKGLARFSPGLLKGEGGREAVLVTAGRTMSGFTFLQLDQAAFDLSDRGVSGRSVSGPLDGYVYTERGVYRPGETVNAVALLRDSRGKSVAALPLTLRLFGPDGKVTLEKLLQADTTGAYMSTLALSGNARTGNWNVALYVDVNEKPVAETNFQVRAFVPPRLEISLKQDGLLTPESEAIVQLQADYLFGAPAGDLPVNTTMSLDFDPHPFAEYHNFYFGEAGVDVNIPDTDLDELITDENGGSLIPIKLDGYPATTQPVKVTVRVSVMDIDGRTVSAVTSVPVRHLQNYIGIRPLFPGKRAQANSSADFKVIVLDELGAPIFRDDIRYRLVQEEVDYQWFRKGSNWGYERIVRDREVERNRLQISPSGSADISTQVARGDYRLELYGPGNKLFTSSRFSAGDQVVGVGNTPDAVQVELDQSQYRSGGIARMKITAPYTGEASLVLASNRLHSIKNFKLDSITHDLEIPVDSDWGGGVYALVTVYRPGEDSSKGAGRAVGLVWISVDPAAQRLNLAMDIPERVRPRQTVYIPVTVQGGTPGEEINLTLAAVDEGVLQMTNFVSPDPLEYFFGKQRLGTEIRDLYGRLITAPNGKPLVVRQGAGDNARRGAPETNIRVVSLFSGVVTVDAEGFAGVPLTLPDFNGRLRLMAVAWSHQKMGAVDGQLPVNDPVVVSPSLPRFLARGDQTTINVLLQNIDGPQGQYTVTLSAGGALSLNGNPDTAIRLARGKRQAIDFQVRADRLGLGQLDLRVEGPDNYQYTGRFALNVRGRYLPLLTRTFHKIDAGETLQLSSSLIAGLYPETATVDASFSSSPNLDVPGILGQLDRYPYGCLEQLTSRVIPLLYANELAVRWGYPADDALHGRIMKAIDLIFQKQRADGSFGLWSDLSPAEPWLSAYAMDFFTRARQYGFYVPDYLFNKGLQWLTDSVISTKDPDKKHLSALAYAHYVLARTGMGKPEDARYLFDNYLEDMPSALGKAHIAGALALQGDPERADRGFAEALATRGVRSNYWYSYGSPLRDLAAVIRVLDEAAIASIDPADAWNRLIRVQAGKKYLSTQEQTWLVLAALTLDEDAPLLLSIDDKLVDTDKNFIAIHRDGETMADVGKVVNRSRSAIWAAVTVQGTPSEDLPPVSERFQIQREWLTPSGEPLESEAMQQGALLLVVINGEVQSGEQHRALVVDLLPAGFEFERALKSNDDSYDWPPQVSQTRYTDGLDDRFVAAIDTDQLDEEEGIRRFTIAYLIRAVTPGEYNLPPVEVEDMYKPEYRARGHVGTVRIER